jgi:flagellum-specific peptidoglycan hydrolase FlgJ
MPNVKDKAELLKMPQADLIKYCESLDEPTYNGYLDADVKVRYFLAKYGRGIANAIKKTNLFFPAVVAQSITESGYGRRIPTDSNNFGGIKYAPNLAGVIGYVLADTTEVVNGKKIPVKAKFSKFADAESGFKAHVQVLLGDRYKNARLNAKTPEEQIKMIASAGYTTSNPTAYVNSMKGNINRVRNTSGLSIIN